MHHVSVIQKLIEHTAPDFTSYFAGTDLSTDAARIIQVALTDPSCLTAERQLLGDDS